MGYRGIDLNDSVNKYLRELQRQGKLNLVDQSDCLFTHSGMRIPNDELIKKIYQKQIIKAKNYIF